MRKILSFWLFFLTVIFTIYISTETIVPKEFTYINLGKNFDEPQIKFDYQKQEEIQIIVEKLSSVNQFLLTRIDPIFKETKKQGISILNLQYSVKDQSDNYIFQQYLTKNISQQKLISSQGSRINLPYIFNFKSDSLIFEIKVLNKDQIIDYIENFQIYIETNNEQFLYFFLYLKIFLFLLSIYYFLSFSKKYFQMLQQ